MTKINDSFFVDLQDISIQNIIQNTKKAEPQDPDIIANAIRKSFFDLDVECPICHARNFIRFGSRQKLFKDIPYDKEKIAVNVKREKYRCRDCGLVFMPDLKCMNDVRRMTNRLYDYVILRCQETNYKIITEETGLSRRTLQYITSEYLDSNYENMVYQTTILLVDKWNGQKRYVILDEKDYGVLGATKSLDAAIKRILKYYSGSKNHKILIPYDESLVEKLTKSGINRENIYFDYESYSKYIVGKFFEIYKQDRALNKKSVTTNSKDEKRAFYQRENAIGPEDEKVLDEILSNNKVFRTYYEFKEDFLDRLKANVSDVVERDADGFACLNFMNGNNVPHLLFDLISEIESVMKNIVVMNPWHFEKARYIFNNVCTDMDNGVLEDWICYKYNKQ